MDKIQVVLCIDECKSNNPQTLGCLTMPVKTFKQVEAEALNYRLSANLWGELKYTAINNSYLTKYQDFLDLFLSQRAVDILTGLTASYYSKTNPHPSKIILRDNVSKKYNDGVMLFKVRSRTLPSLFDYKIHAYLLSENTHHIQISSMPIS